jgi:hypothetical protein
MMALEERNAIEDLHRLSRRANIECFRQSIRALDGDR